MSKNRYSEEEAVQKPAGELLTKLGWDIQCCFDEEKLGLYGTLGRESYHDVLLRRDLESALTELNEWMDEADVAEAIKTLEHTFVGDSLLPDQRGQVQHPARRHSRTQAGRGWHAPHRACANISLHNPLRIVFVCAMWLTGFDVKPLSVMYFDKPMKAHGLMQAIARQSRGRGQEQRPYRGLRGRGEGAAAGTGRLHARFRRRPRSGRCGGGQGRTYQAYWGADGADHFFYERSGL